MSLAVPTVGGVPDPRAGGPGLSRHRGHVADRAAGARGDGPLLRDLPRHRSTAASTRSPPRPRTPTRRARERVAAFTARRAGETVFTQNATEAINLVAYSWGRANVGAGRPRRAHGDGAPLEHRPVAAARLRGSRTCRSTTTGCSTSTRSTRCSRRARSSSPSRTSPTCSARSTRSPRSSRARTPPARSCWSTARRPCRTLPVDVAELDADFYAWTGHKAYGPTGIGVLHGRRELLEAMPPFLGGGHMIARVGDFESTWAEPPAKFEAGTMPIAEAIGLGAAVDWLAEIGMDAVREHGRDVTAYALERLAEVPGLRIHGPPTSTQRGSLVCVRARRRPPARRGRDPRPRGRLRARRPPLRAAADAPARRRRRRRARRSPCTPRARTSTR